MQEKAGEQGAAYIPMPKGRGFTPHFDKIIHVATPENAQIATKKPRRVLIKSFLQSSIKNILSLLIITVQSNHIIISKIKIQKTEYITKFCLIFRLLLKK